MNQNISSNIIVSTEEEAKYIENTLYAFNEKNGPFPVGEEPKLLNFIIKNDDEIIAGINALFFRFISYVDILGSVTKSCLIG